MASDPSIIVGIATYNELENLPSLVEAIHVQLPQAHVLVVDDNSPDGTGDWCRSQATDADWFTYIVRDGKLGLGSALSLLMQSALDRGATYLVTMDADWSHPPDALPRMFRVTQRADVVVGSRYCPGGKIVGWPLHRRIASRLINGATRWVAGLGVRDCSGNFRVYSTDVLARINLSTLNTTGYAFIEEVLWELKRAGARFAEVPITFTDRQAGSSKISWRELFGAAGMLLRLAAKRLTGRRS